MMFLKTSHAHVPVTDQSDIEASRRRYSAQFPECDSHVESEEAAPMSHFLPGLFVRSPSAINKNRAALLSGHEKQDNRLSIDVESQVSTDASTLLESETVKKQRSRFGARVISDAIIGLSDGLTVPFALTAGLSTLGDTRVVVFAGLAELTAGAISMGLGGYLGAKSEEESSKATLKETQELVERSPSAAVSSIAEVFAPYELPQNLQEDLQFHLVKSPHLLQFLMHFQHNTPEQEASRAITCALTIAGGYFLGGFIPLLPYVLVNKEQVLIALWWSLGVMAVSLFVFGYGKTCFVTGWRGWENIWQGTKGGAQMMVVGGVAAGCAMGLVRLFDSFAGA